MSLEFREPQRSPNESNGGGKFNTFHEAFTAYMGTSNREEKAAILTAWLELSTSLDDLLEFMDWISGENQQLSFMPEDDTTKIDFNTYERLYKRMDEKITEVYLHDVEQADSITKLEVLYAKIDHISDPDEGRREIPTFKRWLILATTKAELEKLLGIIENDYGDNIFVTKLKHDIAEKIKSIDN